MSAPLPIWPARCAGVVLLLLLSGAVRGQDQEQPVVVPFDGSQAFRGLLHQAEFRPLANLDQANEDPSRTILIVLGDTSILNDPRLKGGLDGFLNRGGAALIATDREWDWPSRGLAVTGDAHQALPGVRCYQNYSACPYIEPTINEPFFRGSLQPNGTRAVLKQVVANRPSSLDNYQGSLPTVAALRVNPDIMVQVSFAAASRVGKGRALVIADHSVFINLMLILKDTDNYDFTSNCVEWLAGDQRQRDRVLFVENGTIQESFDVPLTVPKFQLPPLDAFVPAANAFLDNVQRETNGFNTIAVPNEHRRGMWLAIVAIGLVALTAGLSFIWLSRARHRNEPQLPLMQQSLVRHAPGESLQTQRHRAQLTAGNLWEAARLLIRHELPQLAGPKPPVVRTANAARRRTLQKQVERLWKLAWGPVPETVSAERFARLPPEVHALKQALASGSFQLDVSS